VVVDAVMQLGVTFLRDWRRARWAAPALLGLVWLTMALASVSPELHQLLHSDSHNTGHECIVTLLGQSLVLSENCPLLLVTPVRLADRVSAHRESLRLPAADHPLAPSRAPPVLAA
jgi:hypothetical protein